MIPVIYIGRNENIYSSEAEKVETVLEVPLIEDLPKGFMAVRKGRRDMNWRSDRPATLVFAEALDGGDPAMEVEYRDQVYELEAPFNGAPRALLKTLNRYGGITWGDEQTAIAYDSWWNTRNSKTYLFNPSDPSSDPVVLFDLNYQDRYSDPGNFVTERNEYGSYVLSLNKDKAYLIGSGYTPEGQFPFLDQMNLKTSAAFLNELHACWDSLQGAGSNRVQHPVSES